MGPIEAFKRLKEKESNAGVNSLWLICFTGRERCKFWWDRVFTTRHWRHCFALQYQHATRTWVVVDWRTGLQEVTVLTHEELPFVFGLLEDKGGTGVLYRRQIPEREVLYRIPLIYCVQSILQLLGMNTEWTFTPQQLYKRLIREGGEEILNYRSESHG
jgi:hypothetical protein